jgi:hypothetical protein
MESERWRWCCWTRFLECGKHINELKPSIPSTKQITWERKDGQERANILLNLKDSTLQHIPQAKTSKET